MPRLEWIGKEKVVNHAKEVPFHVLENKYCYGDGNSGNKVIHGDNLVALKSLLPEYEGRVKCIYIDKRQAYLIQANGKRKSPKALDTRGSGDCLLLVSSIWNSHFRRKRLITARQILTTGANGKEIV